jgi:hypothetical protein
MKLSYFICISLCLLIDVIYYASFIYLIIYCRTYDNICGETCESYRSMAVRYPNTTIYDTCYEIKSIPIPDICIDTSKQLCHSRNIRCTFEKKCDEFCCKSDIRNLLYPLIVFTVVPFVAQLVAIITTVRTKQKTLGTHVICTITKIGGTLIVIPYFLFYTFYDTNIIILTSCFVLPFLTTSELLIFYVFDKIRCNGRVLPY